MKKSSFLPLVLLGLSPFCVSPLLASTVEGKSNCAVADAATDTLDAAKIVTVLKAAADWQLANPHGNTPITDWVAAPHYDGLLRLALATGDEKYLAAVLSYGRKAGWQPHVRPYHADDIAVAHAWLEVYSMDTEQRRRLEPAKAWMDFALEHPRSEKLDFRRPKEFPGVAVTDRWTWCDALYMAPPSLARLYSLTGDKKYLTFMDREYRYTYDQLWDPEEKLFFRDGSFIGRQSPNGRKVFWGRGNGWVYGGLCLVLESLPKDWPTRPFYENLYREMTVAVLAAQQADGLWRPNLLDPKEVDIGETSASGFYLFGLSWGINHGLLEREAVWPAAVRAMRGLLTRVKPDGYVGYVQRIGSAPDSVGEDSRQDYGTGALLLAGSEMLKSLGAAKSPTDLKAFLKKAEALSAQDKGVAYARLVPERKDDLAFENDKVAFRIYGPALRDSIEASGIDAWFKRTASPVINRWYALDLAGVQSYHEDHGEGYDGFKVADSLGCGGLGLLHHGKLIAPDTYEAPMVYDTTPDYAKFSVVYHYREIKGLSIEETRTFTLRAGEQLLKVNSKFRVKGAKASELQFAAGLYTQGPSPVVVQDAERGFVSVWEKVDGIDTGFGISVDPEAKQGASTVLGVGRLPHGEGHEQVLLILKPSDAGELNWRAGFAWSKAGEITTLEAWLAYLKSHAGK